MGGGGERHRDGLALEFGERLHGRRRRHHDAVAAALYAAGQHTDEQAALASIQMRDAIERAGKSAMAPKSSLPATISLVSGAPLVKFFHSTR